jgi:ketosteroid isomerase-like protein
MCVRRIREDGQVIRTGALRPTDRRVVMPVHPNADRARKIFDALWINGDSQPLLDASTDDFEWVNDIGAGPWRVLRGKDEAIAMQLWWFAFFEGNFRHELIDICASDSRVIEVLREVGEKDGHVFDNVALYVYEVDDDGQFCSLQTFDRDRDNVTAFWAAFPGAMDLDTGSVIASMVPTDAD